MRIKYIIILLTTIILSACGKFLDVKPKGKLIPSSVKDFDNLLDNFGIVNSSFQGGMLSYLTDNVVLSEGISKVYYVANNSTYLESYYAYIFRQPYRRPTVSDLFWIYGTIGVYNNIIKGVNEVKTAADAKYAGEVIAQAKVGRAWAYFIMNLLYGPVYKPGTANSTKTIPFVTNTDIEAPMVDLSTQEEMFAHIARDLHDALPDIPVNTTWPSRPNKVAAYTMLAYYHLFTQKFDSVAYYANLGWTQAAAGGVDKLIYNYNSFSWKTPNNLVNSEIAAPDNLLMASNNRETILHKTPDFGGQSPRCYPSDELIALFDRANDLRFKYFFLSAPGYKTTYNGVTYDDGNRIQYYRSNKTQMTGGFTFPELLLMRAEGYARTNKLAEAVDDLNTLRKYRYVTGTPVLTPGTQDQVIQMVLDERRRELPLSHYKRLLDLKRFVLETGKPWSKTKITHTVGSQVYEGTIDSPDFILNISNFYLQYNPQWGVPLDIRPF